MDVDALPDELLVQVFVALEHPSYLPALALVCRCVPPPAIKNHFNIFIYFRPFECEKNRTHSFEYS
jgi:hypothetical protein